MAEHNSHTSSPEEEEAFDFLEGVILPEEERKRREEDLKRIARERADIDGV